MIISSNYDFETETISIFCNTLDRSKVKCTGTGIKCQCYIPVVYLPDVLGQTPSLPWEISKLGGANMMYSWGNITSSQGKTPS